MCVFFATFAAEFNYSMALTRTYYRVAEHLFAVECGDSALLQCMTNYEPFKQPTPNPSLKGRELGEKIFTLRVEGDKREARGEKIFTLRVEGDKREARGEEWTHVLTDNAEDMPRIEVYQASRREGNEVKGERQKARGWMFRVAMVANAPICCEMECSEDFTNGVLYITTDCQDVRFCIDNALMLLFAFRTAPLMTLEMHAAVVVREARGEDKGFLFLGYSGTGKSTHARQWLAAYKDAWLLNDDNPILRVMPNGEVRVYGSPWSGKTPCYQNAYAKVGGIVKLSQAPYNKIRRVSLPEAYAYLLSSASGLKMERRIADSMYESIKYVITHVKCSHMECLPNVDAAKICYQGIMCT